jgi:hypothetical protein
MMLLGMEDRGNRTESSCSSSQQRLRPRLPGDQRNDQGEQLLHRFLLRGQMPLGSRAERRPDPLQPRELAEILAEQLQLSCARIAA